MGDTMGKKSFLFLLIFSAVSFSFSFAQDKDNVLADLQKKFKNVKDFKADFSQNSAFTSQAKSSNLKGTFFYKKDNKFRIEFSNSQLISDGKTLWNYNKKENKVFINNLENEYSFFSLKDIILDYPDKSFIRDLGSETINGSQYKIIQITPKNGNSSFETIKIWFNETNFIGRVEVIDSGGSKHQFELSSVKINQKIPSNMFDFSPPKGTEVIDLR
jgi:outer membrane lipoprotein carrier protein